MTDADLKALANELIKSWTEWEEHPGTDYTAKQMEATVQKVATVMGTTGTKLRVALSEKRRETGMSVARTVRLLFKHIEKGVNDAGAARQD